MLPVNLSALFGDPAVQQFLLVAARLLPIVALSPVFGGELLTPRMRLGMTVLFTASLAFSMPAATEARPAALFAAAIAGEALVGGLIALAIRFFFDTFTTAGGLLDRLATSTSSPMPDPTTGEDASALARFLRQLAIVVFLGLGGFGLLLEAVADGLVRLPPGTFDPTGGLPGVGGLIALGVGVFNDAVRLAGPVIVAVLVFEVVFGLVGAAARPMQVVFLAMSVRGPVVLLVLALGLSLVVSSTLLPLLVRLLDLIGDVAGGLLSG